MRLFSGEGAQDRQVCRCITAGGGRGQSNSNTAPPPVPALAARPAAAAMGHSSQSSFRGNSTLPASNLVPVQGNISVAGPVAAAAGTLPRAPNPRSAQQTTSTRIQLGGFLNRAGDAIRSSQHATALIGMIQLGAGHADGLAGSLGFNNRTAWMTANIDAFFRVDGPLGAFQPISISVLMRHFSSAQSFAREIFDRDHSNKQSGASQEDIPQWVRHFFRVFEAQQNQVSRNAQDAAVREERRSVIASLVGQQAPLGVGGSNGCPAQLRTETSRNNDVPPLRRQIVGNVDAETIYENNDDNDANVDDGDELVEGRDDVGHRRRAPRRRISNGVCRRNVHVGGGFGLDNNNPSSRFHNVNRGYASLESLSQAVSRSISAPPQLPPRTMINVVREFHETNQFMVNAATDAERAFYATAIEVLQSEMDAMRAEGVTTNGSNNAN